MRYYIITIVLILFMLIKSSTFSKEKYYSTFYKSKEDLQKIIYKLGDLQLTEENFLTASKLFNIQYPHIVLKQALLESGHFRSKVFRKTNNMFGMKVPKRRETFAITTKKTKSGYTYFTSWLHSLADYKLWQGNQIIITNYYDYLVKRNYAECIIYKEKLTAIKI